ncbi:radical SAM protein [Pseudoflavonifractor sp. 524-17]|uniref:radical SAM protein n=1 Tax=Pseudoflavonifractor sp. 524-17 TaxID=2304577 RepID=UPI001379EDE8|nr:radical SAM protein [Pseudoflavonifractor sp. 524-17]NCE63321.1 radical SAM protein [Pseudoflavonifractor sp. 524-17]
MRYEGTIFRPPGEWRSYLLQVTIGCSHNQCTFCSMYKGKRFRVRPLEEIFEDIELAKAYYGRIGQPVKRVFLCDGDAIIQKTGDLLAVLERLYDVFPQLERVSAYTGPRSTLSKTPEELAALKAAGLYRVYLGVETGDSALLHAIKKGVNGVEMLAAGAALREAGLDLWVMILLGLAGPGAPSRRHILATADLINQMRPRHLSALTLLAEPGTKLGDQVERGEFQLITGAEALEETRLLLEHLEVNPLHFTCDHASNYLPLKGGLPEDRDTMLAAIDAALKDEALIRSEYGRGL